MIASIEDLDRTHDLRLAARMNREHSRARADPAGEIPRAAPKIGERSAARGVPRAVD
jgi:hypothetical protein